MLSKLLIFIPDYHRATSTLQSARITTDCVFSDSSDITSIPPNFFPAPTQPTVPSSNTPNVNIRQASPDESESKVSVANLSPVPLRSSFGSTLNVPNSAFAHQQSPTTSLKYEFDVNENKRGEEPVVESSNSPTMSAEDWACVFQSMNPEYKVHFLPVLHNEAAGSGNLCDNKLLDSLGAHRNRSVSNSFLPIKTSNQSDDCDSGCASIDRNVSSDQNTGNNSLRTAHKYESNSGEASLSSPSLLGIENIQGDKAPLIIRRLRKKHTNLGGESSLSSQSDVPEDSKDKNFVPDSSSLDC